MATQNDDTAPAPPSLVDDLLANSPGNDAPFIEPSGPNDSLTDSLNASHHTPVEPMSTPESIMAGEVTMAEGRLRAAETLARRIENKELLSAAELQYALGIAQAEIDDAVEANRLFAFEGPDGEPYYPAFYADAIVDRSALELVAQELRDLPAPSKYHFFISKRTNLGATPLEALKRGRVAEVLQAASAFAII